MKSIIGIWMSVMLVIMSSSGEGVTSQLLHPLKAADRAEETPLTITVIDYGEDGWGDGALVESDGEYLLMDTYITDCYEELKNYLLEHDCTEFAIYLSHYHADHFSNIKPLIRDEQFTITHLYLPDRSYMTVTEGDYEDNMWWFKSQAEDIPEVAQEYGVPVTYLTTGDTFEVGAAQIEILRGPDYEKEDHDRSYLNSNSLVTRVTGGGIRFLTCGDIEKERERQLIDLGLDLQADILKLNHHGGDTSNDVAFLEAVSPLFAYGDYNGDTPSTFAADWSKAAMTNVMKIANVHSVRYNGTIQYRAVNGNITVTAERNVVSFTDKIYNSRGIAIGQVTQMINDKQTRIHRAKEKLQP